MFLCLFYLEHMQVERSIYGFSLLSLFIYHYHLILKLGWKKLDTQRKIE